MIIGNPITLGGGGSAGEFCTSTWYDFGTLQSGIATNNGFYATPGFTLIDRPGNVKRIEALKAGTFRLIVSNFSYEGYDCIVDVYRYDGSVLARVLRNICADSTGVVNSTDIEVAAGDQFQIQYGHSSPLSGEASTYVFSIMEVTE